MQLKFSTLLYCLPLVLADWDDYLSQFTEDGDKTAEWPFDLYGNSDFPSSDSTLEFYPRWDFGSGGVKKSHLWG